MTWLTRIIYGKTKVTKKKKRKLLVFISAITLFLGAIVQIAFHVNTEFFLLAGFGAYSLSELFE